MRELLRYVPQEEASLQPTQFADGEVFYSGQAEYRYQEEYVVTRGIKKGLLQAKNLGLIPEEYQNTTDAVLEVTSNNMLPGLTDDNERAQFVKFRGGTSMASLRGRAFTDILLSQCIFGEFGSTYILNDGAYAPVTSPKTSVEAPIRDIVIDPRLSLYEHDAIQRQTALLRKITHNNEQHSSVTISVPRVSYYLHTLQPYNNGHIDPEQMFSWFDSVDERYQVIVDAIRNQVPTHLECNVLSPLESTEGLIREQVRLGKKIEIEPLMQHLMGSDPMWAMALKEHIPASESQFRNEFAEAIEERRMPRSDVINSRIVMKGPKEEGTFELGSRINSIANIAPVVAMYALPQIVTAPQGCGLYRAAAAPTPRDISLIANQYS